MERREMLRKELEAKARNFWYDFNCKIEERIKANHKFLQETYSRRQIDWAESHGYSLDGQLKQETFSEEEIKSILGRASIGGLALMNPGNVGRMKAHEIFGQIVHISDYKQTLDILDYFYDERGCKRCVMHLFDYPTFNEKVASNLNAYNHVMKNHPIHKIDELIMIRSSYQVIGGPLTYMPEDIPEVNKINKQIEKLERKEERLRRLEKDPTSFQINSSFQLNVEILEAVRAQMQEVA